jgi:hypothetical protein
MRLSRIIPLALAAASLASCQTMTPEERRAAHERTCASYGFRAGSEGMARCLLDLDLERRAELRSLQAQTDPFFWSPVVVERRVVVHR